MSDPNESRTSLRAAFASLAAAQVKVEEALDEQERYRQEARESAAHAGRALRELREARAEADSLRAERDYLRKVLDTANATTASEEAMA